MTTPTPRRGRPPTLPDGTRIRGLRLTDAEYVAVKRFIASMRKKPRRKSNPSSASPS